jgi:hypothetical protein
MKKLFPAFIILIVVGILIFTAYFFRDRFNKKPAGLEIRTTPAATVLLNGRNVGLTPYIDQNLAAGSYTIKLVPEPLDGAVFPEWETRVELTPSVTTAINRTFASSEQDSSTSTLHLIKEPGDKTYLSVISEPDTISLTIDGKPSGFTPATKLDTVPGSHVLTLSSPGYKTQELTVGTVSGYNLIVSVKLSADQLVLTPPPPAETVPDATSSASSDTTPSPTPASSSVAKPYVLINETGTGWLRVRREPSSTADELGKADVGEKLPYLGESTETGWHKIEFETQTGWVSGKYVDLVK